MTWDYAIVPRNVTRYNRGSRETAPDEVMIPPAERMKMMRERRRAHGLREVRLIVPDARSRAVRKRIARQVAGLPPDSEREALAWIESVAAFDGDEAR